MELFILPNNQEYCHFAATDIATQSCDASAPRVIYMYMHNVGIIKKTAAMQIKFHIFNFLFFESLQIQQQQHSGDKLR